MSLYHKTGVNLFLFLFTIDLKPLKEESQELNKMEKKNQYEKSHDFMTGEKSLFIMTQKTETRSLEVHTEENAIRGQQCGKSFSQKLSLKMHLKIHSGEKLFICPRCGKGFTLNKTLSAHLRIHTGEKPYSCELCGKVFPRKESLKVHMRIHTGEKPYP